MILSHRLLLFHEKQQNCAINERAAPRFCYNKAMDKDVLSEVIEAEREIQKCIDAEQSRLRQWLEDVRKEAEAAVAREEERNNASAAQALEDAKKQAEAEAVHIRGQAEAEAAALANIEDRVIAGIVLKHISRILME